MSYRLRRLIRFMTASALAICFSTVGLYGASPVAANTTSSNSEGMIAQMKLTGTQAQALRKAWGAHQHLSTQQAQRVIDSASGGADVGGILAKPAYAGFAESYGGCSHMWMWGYNNGYYDWNMSEIGYPSWASFGEVSISTNGFAQGIDDHWFGSGFYQRFRGNLWTGWGASGTTMSGWMVTQNNTYCSGTLFASW